MINLHVMMLAELVADQASTPVTAQQAHKSTTPTSTRDLAMASLSQENLVQSPLAVGQADDNLINFELAGQISKSAAVVDNLDNASDGWMRDTAERQSAFRVPPVHKGTRVPVDSEVEFYFRDDRSPVIPRPFRYESRQSSRAPSRRSGMSERSGPMLDVVKQLVEKISVDAAG